MHSQRFVPLQDIPSRSWIDPRIEVRSSPIHGKGIFASAIIPEGTMVITWGGTLFTHEAIKAGKALEHSDTAIRPGIFLGHTPEQGYSADDYMNHSCDPSVWFLNEITLVARRVIYPGDEVSADMAMFWGPEELQKKAWKCRCRSALCRKMVTSQDWQRADLHQRYGDHFSPYLLESIERFCKTPTARPQGLLHVEGLVDRSHTGN